ncbi:MAG TPA: DUF4440 domain-containing protein [Longimicrobium sp.]|nr:DUF4440 domain-containing protein [Longimicrobium sp.]
MLRIRPVIVVLCAALLAACTVRVVRDPEGTARRAAEADVAQIEELGRQFSAAYMRGDIEAMVQTYTADAVIFPGNSEAIRGHDAIRRYWTLPPGQRITHHRATPTEIRVDGGHAYDHGVYEIAGERGGTAWGPSHGKYVIVWRREPAGWRMHLDMWNSRPQP